MQLALVVFFLPPTIANTPLALMVVIAHCNLRWWCFSSEHKRIYQCVYCNLRCVVVVLLVVVLFMWWWLYICGGSGCTWRFCCCYTTKDPSWRTFPVIVYTFLRTDSPCPMYCARIQPMSLARPGVSENVADDTLAQHLPEHLYTTCLLFVQCPPTSCFIVSSQ